MRRHFLFGCLLLLGSLNAALAQKAPKTQTAHPTRPNYHHGGQDWESKTPPDSSHIRYTVFLIGDVGKPAPKDQGGEPSLNFLHQQIVKAGAKSTTIYLGDNIYEYGMPRVGAYDRKASEERMIGQLDALRGYAGEKYMIPGNHDWKQGLTGGRGPGEPRTGLRGKLPDLRLGFLRLHRRLLHPPQRLPRPLRGAHPGRRGDDCHQLAVVSADQRGAALRLEQRLRGGQRDGFLHPARRHHPAQQGQEHHGGSPPPAVLRRHPRRLLHPGRPLLPPVHRLQVRLPAPAHHRLDLSLRPQVRRGQPGHCPPPVPGL